ncbi:MAG: hypothetical protein AcusKO_36370 [Acuticoccus sp.]
MIERIAVCCNSLIPGSGAPSSAQGLRANGLYLGLTAAGFAVDIVNIATSVSAQLDRWDVERVRIPGHWRIIQEPVYLGRLNNDYDVVIFPNWPVAKGFQKAGDIKVVYDFFSATQIEHAVIASPADVAERRTEKLQILAQADYVIANGGVQADYARTFMEEAAGRTVTGTIPPVRLALPYHGVAPPPSDRLRLFFGGFLQAWTTGIDLGDLETLAEENDLEIHTMGFGQHVHFRDLSRAGRHRPVSRRVVLNDVASFQSYQDLNARCDVALDIFEPNEERRISYSTRAVSAIAAGCPLITMSFTEIGRLVGETGAGWTLDTFSLPALRELIAHLKAHPEEIAAARARTQDFWRAYIDPARQVEPLAEMLRSNAPNVA